MSVKWNGYYQINYSKFKNKEYLIYWYTHLISARSLTKTHIYSADFIRRR